MEADTAAHPVAGARGRDGVEDDGSLGGPWRNFLLWLDQRSRSRRLHYGVVGVSPLSGVKSYNGRLVQP